MTRIAIAAILGSLICIPAGAALPTITKPSVKLEKPAISKGADGTISIKKGEVKVEKPELKLPDIKKPEMPELKKPELPELKKPELPEIKKPTLEKPSVNREGDAIKINKGGIKLK